jgi:hypothetical protein
MEELLKEIMGDAYKDNMSKDDVTAFFKKQVLASGDYENAGKSKAEKKELSDKIAELQAELEAKMTDDDKKKKADADMQKMVEQLQKQLAESKINQSKMTALSALAEAKIKAGIKDDDTSFDEFVSGISFEDAEKTSKLSKYVSQIVASAYEAGKSEAIKNKLGKMGDFKDGSGDSQGANADKGAFGRELAKATNYQAPEAKDFFSKK